MTELKKSLFDEITESPREHYTFRFEEKDMQQLSKTYLRRYILRPIPFILLLIGCCAFGASGSSFNTGLASGLLFCVLLTYFISRRNYKKRLELSSAKAVECVYDYTVYEDFFVIWISSNDSIKQKRIYLSDVKEARATGELLVLWLDDGLYMLRMDELDSDSAFRKLCDKKKKK